MAHRTQIYLDDAQYEYVKSLARSKKKSIAQIFRDWLEEKKTKKRKKKYENDSLFKLRGIFASNIPDIAEHFDDYLYGDKK